MCVCMHCIDLFSCKAASVFTIKLFYLLTLLYIRYLFVNFCSIIALILNVPNQFLLEVDQPTFWWAYLAYLPRYDQ